MKNKEPLILVIVLAIIAVGGVAGFVLHPFDTYNETTTALTTEAPSLPEETTAGTRSESGGEIYVYDVPEETAASEDTYTYTYYFKNDDRLNEHYEKHKYDTQTSSVSEYLYRANYVIENDASLHKTEKEDNDTVYYLESTNEFVVVAPEGFIRTYFCPDDGKAYYDRQ